MSMQVLPTAPSPTVTHLINLEAVAAIEQQQQVLTKVVFVEFNRQVKEERETERERERVNVYVCVCVYAAALHMILTHSLAVPFFFETTFFIFYFSFPYISALGKFTFTS